MPDSYTLLLITNAGQRLMGKVYGDWESSIKQQGHIVIEDTCIVMSMTTRPASPQDVPGLNWIAYDIKAFFSAKTIVYIGPGVAINEVGPHHGLYKAYFAATTGLDLGGNTQN